jgi:hypothetical protein
MRRLARVLLRGETEPYTAWWAGAGPAVGGGMGFFLDPLEFDPESGTYKGAGPRQFKTSHEVMSITFFDVE